MIQWLFSIKPHLYIAHLQVIYFNTFYCLPDAAILRTSQHNAMSIDALDPCEARTSSVLIISVCNVEFLVLRGSYCHLFATPQCPGRMWKTYIFYVLSDKISALQYMKIHSVVCKQALIVRANIFVFSRVHYLLKHKNNILHCPVCKNCTLKCTNVAKYSKEMYRHTSSFTIYMIVSLYFTSFFRMSCR